MNFTKAETGAILAGLRFVQEFQLTGRNELFRPNIEAIDNILGECGKLSAGHIDELSERINMPEVERIYITLEGGLIQDIEGIPEGVEIVKMDFDTEGADEEKVTHFTTVDLDGTTHETEACIGVWSVRNDVDGTDRERLDTVRYADLIRQLPR